MGKYNIIETKFDIGDLVCYRGAWRRHGRIEKIELRKPQLFTEDAEYWEETLRKQESGEQYHITYEVLFADASIMGISEEQLTLGPRLMGEHEEL